MVALSPRQSEILLLAVKNYLEHGESSSSFNLKKQFRLPYSAPTIRNDLKVLEELGYLDKQFFSSGRKPTIHGIDYYIKNRVIDADSLQKKEFRPTETSHINRLADQSEDINDFVQAIAQEWKVVTLAFNDATFSLHGLRYMTNLLHEDRDDLSADQYLESLLASFDDQVWIKKSLTAYFDEGLPQILIGDASRISKQLHCSLILSQLNFNNDRFNIAFIDSPRTNYARNYQLATLLKNINL